MIIDALQGSNKCPSGSETGVTASLTSRRRPGTSRLMSGCSTFASECYPLGSGGGYPPYVQILDPLRDQEGCLELSDEIPRLCYSSSDDNADTEPDHPDRDRGATPPRTTADSPCAVRAQSHSHVVPIL